MEFKSAGNDVVNNIQRICAVRSGGSVYLSTSQMIMVGLALCRPELLEKANYPARDVGLAWTRLDDAQRAAIVSWWKRSDY